MNFFGSAHPPPPDSELLCALGTADPHQVLSIFSCLPFLNLLVTEKPTRDDSVKVNPARPQAKRALPALGTTGCISCFRSSLNVNSSASLPCHPLKWPPPVIPTSPCSSLCALNTVHYCLLHLLSVPQNVSSMKGDTLLNIFC